MKLLQPGTNARLDKVRERIEALLAESRSIEKQPLSEAEFRADIRSDITELITTYPPVLTHSENPRELGSAGLNRAMAFVIRAFNKLDPSVVEQVMFEDTKPAMFGLPPAERAKRLEALRAERTKLEEEEERIHLKLRDEGYTIVRRKGFDPELVLRVLRQAYDAATAAT